MRESARDPRAAQRRYLRILQRTISCVSPTAQLYLGPSPDQGALLGLASAPTMIPLSRGEAEPLGLRLRQIVQPIRDEDFAGEFRFTTRAYVYAVHSSPDFASSDALVYWHWNPSHDAREPHVHAPVADPAGRGSRLHLPTGRRVSVEQIVEHLIAEWDVEPARDDWESVLADSRTRFDTYRRQD